MNKKLLIMVATASIFVSGCSISIGGGNDAQSNNVVYDCSVLSDQAQKELSSRTRMCSFDSECKEMAIQSACKPVISQPVITKIVKN
jgi:hypothetical protein